MIDVVSIMSTLHKGDTYGIVCRIVPTILQTRLDFSLLFFILFNQSQSLKGDRYGIVCRIVPTILQTRLEFFFTFQSKSVPQR